MILNMEFDTDQPFDFEFGDWLLALLSDPNSVKYTPQEKTNEEKSQARKNIAAAVDVITSDDYNNPKRLIDLPEGPHELTGFFAYNAQSDEEGITFHRDLVAVNRFDVDATVLVQGFKGRVLHSIIVSEGYVEHESKNIFEQDAPDQALVPFDPDPTMALKPEMLSRLYKPFFYKTLPGAVSDINAGTTDNADATSENAVCALYTDYDGNTCLTLLSNIELTEVVTISAENVVFRINGYTTNITCAGYAFSISGKVTIDGRVDGSSMKQAVSANSVNTALLHVPGDLNLLGGSFDVSSEEASKFVAGIANSGNTAIDGCSISATVNGGTASCYGINSTNTLKAHNSTISATSESEGGLAYSVSTTNKSVDMIMNGCKIAGRSNKTIVGVVIQSASDKPYEIINCDIEVTGATARAINVVNSGIVENCLVNTFVPGEGGGESVGVKTINNTSNLTIRNCTIFADGTTGSANDAAAAGKIASDGIVNTGTMTIENCTVFGTHTGVQCSGGSTTVINGGVYESCSHGGVYISCVGGNFYAQNATFKNVPYKGNHKDIYSYTQAVYMDAAVYIGGSSTSSDIKAYMDNCIMDGTGPCLSPDGDEFIGAEPIRFRGSLGEKNNHIYASNCTLMGDGQIRFANSSHRLYLGYGNRVLCEASIPSCVDATTYARKVFTNYEEN